MNGKKVIDCIHKEMGENLNIAFFPYKVSMWDCMETVYQQAKIKDKPIIVPIPYETLTNDGNISEIHFERDYPHPVEELIDYEINVAIIHNPYGNENTVTRVLSKYWASNLSKYVYTVYIPYFCIGDKIDEAQAFTNGVIFSDMVIVETEKQKSKYLEILKENGVNVDPNKFKVCGSPKEDLIGHYKPQIPLEWMDKANGRKICLLNTSIVPFINRGNAEIDMIKAIFNAYKNNPEWCLLWRPHPLLKDAVASITPQYKDGLNELYECFDGILDDTDDFHRAIEYSDKCISDPSSLVHLYKLTGKEITVI